MHGQFDQLTAVKAPFLPVKPFSGNKTSFPPIKPFYYRFNLFPTKFGLSREKNVLYCRVSTFTAANIPLPAN
jgi:hypothetical protein